MRHELRCFLKCYVGGKGRGMTSDFKVLRRLFLIIWGGGTISSPFDHTAPPSAKVCTCTVKLENELYVLETAKLNAFIYQEGGKKAKYVVLIHHFRKQRKLGQVNFRKDLWDCL